MLPKAKLTTILLLLLPALACGQEKREKAHYQLTDSFGLSRDIEYPRSKLIDRPLFISAGYTGGTVLKSNQSLKSTAPGSFPYAQAANLKFGVSSQGNRWKDIVYGMPYYGIGIGFHQLEYKNLGNPISVYLVQGAIIRHFTPRTLLMYEWNFGSSLNWKAYDPVANPTNESIGASANIFFTAQIFITRIVSKEVDIDVGLSLSHSSNGATRMPNSGVNTVGAFVGLKYHFDRESILNTFDPTLRAPVFAHKHLISDISLHPTIRERKLKTQDTGLSSEYIDHKFFVMNASYALLHMPVYKYRYGLGVDFVYDESAGISARKVGEAPGGKEIAEITYGKPGGRIFVGLSLRGDIVMPKYTVWAHVGYNIVQGKGDDPRPYQAFGLKVPFWRTMYGSFSIRARDLSKAQYFFLGLGYYIDHKYFSFRKRS